MQPSDWIALAAFMVSALAAFYAWRSAVHAKRQAEAAVGNIPPDVEMAAKVVATGPAGRPLTIDVRNKNREAVYVTGFKFDAPEGVRISHIPGPGKPAGPNARAFPMTNPIKVPADAANATRFSFVFLTKGVQPPERYEIKCEVSFRVGYARKIVTRSCYQTVDR